jgi:UDP-3-O-[3-hydroxymyristoyl] glucosamine N-acyltransferase
MENFPVELPTTAADLGGRLGARIVGDSHAEIRELTSLDRAGEGSLSFFADRKYGSDLARVRGAVIFTSEDLVKEDLPVTFLVVSDPRSAFAAVARGFSARDSWTGISPQAVVHPSAELGADVRVGAFAVIAEGVRIGAGSVIHPFAYVGRETRLGKSCQVFPHVVLLERVEIGDRVKIFPGAVIGSDGFGLIDSAAGYAEMPQIGRVVIEDDVRIGANCTIDRATLGETRVRRGSKLDDQVHIGHNCLVERDGVLCAQVGLGGSVVLEENVILGGQVGLGHGVRVGKGARMGGQSGSGTNIKGGDTYFMTPAIPIRDTVKVVKYLRRLPEIWERLKKLEARFPGGE